MKTLQEYLVFKDTKQPGHGYMFPCRNGQPSIEELTETARINLSACLSGRFPVRCQGIEKMAMEFYDPGEIECVCGHHIQLGKRGNDCVVCGREYDRRGNLRRVGDDDQWYRPEENPNFRGEWGSNLREV